MAGNFWLSSHCRQWLLNPEELSAEALHDLKYLTAEETRQLHIFFANFILSLGEALKLRQQVIATATVYFKRFYSRHSLKSADPLLLAPTCLYVASKVEECGPMSNNRLISVCSSVCKTKYAYVFPAPDYPYRINQILECEFFLLEVMDCCLIVFHPYRSLIKYATDMGQEGMLTFAWRVVNDSYRCNVCLLYPPYLIALASIYMACVFEKRDCDQWFAELNVDIERILEVVKHLLALYDLWKNFDETKQVQALLAKMPKPKCNPVSRPSSATPMSHQHTSSPSMR